MVTVSSHFLQHKGRVTGLCTLLNLQLFWPLSVPRLSDRSGTVNMHRVSQVFKKPQRWTDSARGILRSGLCSAMNPVQFCTFVSQGCQTRQALLYNMKVP